jgi:hypothetical protein
MAESTKKFKPSFRFRMKWIVEIPLSLVFVFFPLMMIVFTGGTAHHDKATSMQLYICMELEFILSGLVGLSGLFCKQFSMPFLHTDMNKLLCVTTTVGFLLTSMATTKLLLIELHIRWLQTGVNAVAFAYLALTWADRTDRYNIARGNVDFGRAKDTAERNSSGDGKVEHKYLYQRRTAAHGNH